MEERRLTLRASSLFKEETGVERRSEIREEIKRYLRELAGTNIPSYPVFLHILQKIKILSIFELMKDYNKKKHIRALTLII